MIFTLFRAYNAKIWDRTEAYVFAEKPIKWIKMIKQIKKLKSLKKFAIRDWITTTSNSDVLQQIVPKSSHKMSNF